jgi:hypothetical protein
MKTRYVNAVDKDEEKRIAETFDTWVAGLPQEDKEIVRLHVFNVRAALAPHKVMFGEQAAKVLVSAVYLQVHKTPEMAGKR